MPPLLVVAAIIRHLDGHSSPPQQHLLITRRCAHQQHPGLWEFPGGKLEENESPEAGLRRELDEELGLEVEIEGIYHVLHHRYETGPVLLLVYRCRSHSTRVEHRQVADHAWALPEQLSEYAILPADAELVRRIQRDPRFKTPSL
ncbi:MAG: (deoxy)nucleoside triphosphate pyrophosphohydrolase [Desulfuromonadaceae bacterium]|nr:(deoxy)nucleoside triphosphate pyrophosphohydrolase [Desulfuromonadaceae bacterium]